MCLVQNLIFWLFLRGTNTPPASAGNYDAHPYAFNLVSDITFTKNIKLGFDYDFGKIEQANELAPVTTLKRFQLEPTYYFDDGTYVGGYIHNASTSMMVITIDLDSAVLFAG